MMLIENKYNKDSGFIALIAVVLLASGALAFSFSNMIAAILYADSVYKRELRIQARLNADSCVDTVRLMYAKDPFLSGTTTVADFKCTAFVTNDFVGNMNIKIISIQL